MTDEALSALAEAATRGPWHLSGVSYVYAAGPDGANICALGEPRAGTLIGYTELDLGSPALDEVAANAAFIAAARDAVPALLARVAKAEERASDLTAEVERLKAERATVFELCAKVAEQCQTGVALEINGKKFLLGIMQKEPAAAQRATAIGIAAAIRKLEDADA